MSATTQLQAANTNGFGGLEDRNLKICIAQMLSDLTTTGATPEILSGSGAPVNDPGTDQAIYINTDNGALSTWYSGAWH